MKQADKVTMVTGTLSTIGMAIVAVSLFAVPAAAQQALKFTTIGCSESKIVGSGDLCLASNDRAGGDYPGSSGGGLFKYWVARNKGAELKVYYYVVEAIGARSTVRPSALVDEIKAAIPMAKGATGFTESRATTGADYTTFQSAAGQSCVGIRKLGASRAEGYAWVMFAGSCRPGTAPIGEAEVAAFAAKTDFRN